MSSELARALLRNGFTFGTIERVARDLCEERFQGRNAANMQREPLR